MSYALRSEFSYLNAVCTIAQVLPKWAQELIFTVFAIRILIGRKSILRSHIMLKSRSLDLGNQIFILF